MTFNPDDPSEHDQPEWLRGLPRGLVKPAPLNLSKTCPGCGCKRLQRTAASPPDPFDPFCSVCEDSGEPCSCNDGKPLLRCGACGWEGTKQ